MTEPVLIVIGAGGRLGRILRHCWGDGAAIYLDRRDWDVLNPPPSLPKHAVWLNLAGVTGAGCAVNAALALGVARAVRAHGGRHLFLSSVAVYGGGAGVMRETDAPAPLNAYGRSKYEAEQALATVPHDHCILRLANVAGADAVSHAGQGVVLDPISSGASGPIRSYIGPLTLARALRGLAAADQLPDCLNLAQDQAVAMGDLLTALGRDWRFGPSRADVLERMVVDGGRLRNVLHLPPCSAQSLAAEVAQLGKGPP